MNSLKYLLAITCLVTVIAGCQKEVYDDISFIKSAGSPEKLSAILDITQDNTGMVTITPNGEGTSSYEVYFGDGTVAPAKVQAGKSAQHKYAEGGYTVKIVGHGATGNTAETTKQVTVSFRAPENLEVTAAIDPSSVFKLNVSAKATYETVFKVYFGDVPNEVPVSFAEGETVSHTYATVGNYTVRVVALSGGAATTEFTKIITIVNPVLLPLTFESSTLNYSFINFDGGVSTLINNPQANGINTSAKVVRMVKNAGQPWGGSVIPLGGAMDFSSNKIFRMKVFSPRVGAKVLLKVENGSNGGINFEKEVQTTVANAWEDLAFDFSAINTANSYHNIVLIFELGTSGDGSANYTFLLDDIRLTNVMPAAELKVPLTFENSAINYAFINFDGGNSTVITNPQSNGINTSSKVVRMVKGAGQVWGGSVITLDNPIDFSVKKTFKMKVFSPRVGAKVLLKVENLNNGGISFEREVSTTTAGAWEELTFDFSAINTANTYQKVVFIFELGTMGDGSANYTFLFDDLTLN